MKRRRARTHKMIFLLLSIELLLILGFLAYLQLRPMVVKEITIEAGSDMPDVESFLLYRNRKGSFVSDIRNMRDKAPGVYEVKIKIGSRIHTSSLKIVDTTPPAATVSDKLVLLNEKVEADELVTDLIDATDVTASFLKEPDTSKPGEQKVTVVLEDSGNNRTEKEAVLNVLDINSTVTVEAGSAMNISVKNFVDNDKYEVSFLTNLSELDISKPAVHKIKLLVNGREVEGNIQVVDTTPPRAAFMNREIWNDEVPPAISFVGAIFDATDVTANYKTAPDLTKLGMVQPLTIILTDASGNRTEGQVSATVIADTQPPEIVGISDKSVYVGETITYKKGVTVKDNKDSDLTFKVDSSDVNLKKAGTYKVTYSAEDKAGNKATKEIKITVVKFTVTEDEVYAKADKILADIITDDMTKLEKAKAIYTWIKSHVGYTGHSDKTDWLAEAYRGMKDGVGDCFTYYAVSQALLTRAGIDNMRVTRVGGRTKHFWNLVDCGDGWYHFDSCPNKDHRETFMMTDQQVAELTKIRGNNYYTFDTSLYPVTPEE